MLFICFCVYVYMNLQPNPGGFYKYWYVYQARIQEGGGGGQGGQQGAKNHTRRKKRIKIGQPRSKIQAKTYRKTH